MKFKKKTVYVAGFAAIAAISTAAYAASTATKISPGGSISSTGVHKVPSGTSKEQVATEFLDPRAETRLTDTVTSNSTEAWSYKATYYITSANKTTITQWLNEDTSSNDKFVPIMFLTANLQSNGMYRICNGHSRTSSTCPSGVEWTNVPNSFTIEMSGNGKTASVKIQGVTKTFNMTKTPTGETRANGKLSLRYGVYHHDVVNNKTVSTAQVRVYNITTTGFN